MYNEKIKERIPNAMSEQEKISFLKIKRFAQLGMKIRMNDIFQLPMSFLF